MKAAVLALAMAVSSPVLGQGTIIFANRNIPHPAGGGQTYNIPIWDFGGTGTDGAGDRPGGVRVSLFTDAGVLLGTTLLRSTTSTEFFATANQTLTHPTSDAGTTPSLFLRFWQGSELSFSQAQAIGNFFGEIVFTSRPLGGTPPGGGTPILSPGMNLCLDSAGLTLLPEPSTLALGALGLGALIFRRR